ncbi:CoA transferase [Pandoraea cepalis]|uniref:CoA transferase n=1 Tax=Pandoraea cepalis TaxID=2508294 RepID=A0AAW7MHP0_9BURK|nr:CoA transferase [Pandoraea cepalis]MDN4572210.1 CoA transferase [Pandoraea cepalis]MDN4578444.1 CoA transferase [Pandoraea cepalis]
MSGSTKRNRLPYEGIRVLDLSQGIAGPSCGALLARQGADVIKVEPPAGDWGRLMGDGENGLTAISIGANTGKRALCIDATRAEGRAVLHRMVEQADVLIDSFRPGVMDTLGLGYRTTSTLNAALIHLSITGFGPSGPYRDKAGSDSVLQALGGMMAMNRDGEGVPRRIGMMIVDAACGVYAAQSVGAALFGRRVTGQGEHIELSLLEVTAALQTIPILDHFMSAGRERLPATVPSGTFRTRDGFINVVALRNEMFFRLAHALGHPEWASHDAWSSNAKRLAQRAEINAAIADVLRERDSADWLERLQAHDVLCAAVNDYGDFVADPQVAHAGVFRSVTLGGAPGLPFAGVPGLAGGEIGPVPRQGEHSRRILVELGLSEFDVDALLTAGVVIDEQTGCGRA